MYIGLTPQGLGAVVSVLEKRTQHFYSTVLKESRQHYAATGEYQMILHQLEFAACTTYGAEPNDIPRERGMIFHTPWNLGKCLQEVLKV
jgi:hypothetical protein